MKTILATYLHRNDVAPACMPAVRHLLICDYTAAAVDHPKMALSLAAMLHTSEIQDWWRIGNASEFPIFQPRRIRDYTEAGR